jgi:uncharacterized protein (DUF2249 family)
MTPAQQMLEPFETIDGRAMQPPEPFEKTLEALERLPRGRVLLLLAPCEPRPLFQVLRLNGYDYRCVFADGGWFEVRIWHSADTAAGSSDLG